MSAGKGRRRSTNMSGTGFPSWPEIMEYRVEPTDCPACGHRYGPTPKSRDMCLMCKSGQARIRK